MPTGNYYTKLANLFDKKANYYINWVNLFDKMTNQFTPKPNGLGRGDECIR
jgi:hypothetical protein